jgi:Tfp pilus assembly protein PilV
MPVPRSPSRVRRAFTLIEVMLAASVLVLAISSSIMAMQYGIRSLDTARYTTLAGQILQSQMEKIRLLTWAQLTNTTTGPVAFSTFTPDITSAASEQINRFTCTQSIVAAPSPFNTTMMDITLTATWNGIDGRQHSLSYTSRYGQNGISDFFYTSH